jgi:isopentenyl-diphosphate delta-isomerase
MNERVILVDQSDQEIGTMEKMSAHELGLLHRAISVFLFNDKGELLLQKRASSKYHSGGLWTNTCCSHPRVGEANMDAAIRRLKEEMGICSDLYDAFSFTYKSLFKNGLTEYEFDHVFIGSSEHIPQLNPEEAEDYRYSHIHDVIKDVKQHPEQYTEWFKIAIYKVDEHLKKPISE